MKNSQEIRAEIFDLSAQVEAIVALATSEQREISASEADIVDGIQGSSSGPGRIAQLQDDLDRTSRIEAGRQATFANALRNSDVFRNLDRQSSGFQVDNHGNRFAILNIGDKAASLYSPTCENAFGHFLMAATFGLNKFSPQEIRAAMGGGSNLSGGFLVPEQFWSQIIDLQRSAAVLGAAGSRFIIMETESLSIPRITQDGTFYLKTENAATTASDMAFAQHRMVARTAVMLIYLSRELVEDSPYQAAIVVGDAAAKKAAERLDYWCLAGDATSGQPTGILNSSSIGSTGSVGTVQWSDLVTAALAVRQNNHVPKTAIMSPLNYSTLFTTTSGDGVNSASLWKSWPPVLEGMQFLVTTACPDTKIVVGDFNFFGIGIRSSAMIEASAIGGTAFVNHQVGVKTSFRFDCVSLDDSAFHLLTGIS